MKHRSTDVFLKDAEDEDFVVRERRPWIWQLPILFIVTFSIVYFAADSIAEPTGKLMFIATLAIIIAALSWFVVWFTQRNRDMLLVTEFQNALFASAASLTSRFCMIAKRDGTIVYFDPGFQKVFTEFVLKDLKTIDALLEHENIDKHAVHTILSTMENDTNARTVIPITSQNGEKISMMVTIDTLPRPRGYFLFRGREYVERRSENSKAGIGKALQGMANNLPLGIYVSSPEGRVEFTNKTLEMWLGYNEGEAAESELNLDNVMEGHDEILNASNDGEFESEVVLRCKNGKPVRFHVTQQAMFSGDNTLQGFTGIVTDTDTPDTLKKKA